MRSLGPAVAFSILAHGGVVATVGTLGALWLAGAPPTLPPALYVDLVEPVIATNERIAAVGAPAPRLRRPDPVRRRDMIPAASPREVTDAFKQPDTPVLGAKESTESPPGGLAIVTPEVATPPVAPVAPEPRISPPESAPATPHGAASVPEPVTPSTAPGPRPAAPPVIVPSEVVAPSSPSPPRMSPGSAPDVERGSPIASSPGGAVGRAPLDPSDGSSTAAPSGGARSSEEGDASGVARSMPGGGRSSGGGDGLVPPEYEAYVRAFRQRVQDRLVYPWMAARRGQQGTIELEVRVGAQGGLVGVEVVAGPRSETLRAAAVTAVRGAAPFPFPSGVEGRPLVIRLPVEFQLR